MTSTQRHPYASQNPMWIGTGDVCLSLGERDFRKTMH